MRTELLLIPAALPGLAAESEFESTSAKIWRLYESEADRHDTELAETWRGQTDAMLIFVRTLYRLGHELEGGHQKSLTLLPNRRACSLPSLRRSSSRHTKCSFLIVAALQWRS